MRSLVKWTFALLTLANAAISCGSDPSGDSHSGRGGAGQGASGTGGGGDQLSASALGWDTVRETAPPECEQDDYEILVNTQYDSQFAVTSGSLFVSYPISDFNYPHLDIDQIRLEPFGRRTVFSKEGYGEYLVTTGGRAFWNVRPNVQTYADEGVEEYRIHVYDPATQTATVFIDGHAGVPISSPRGLVAMGTEDAQLTLYPNDGSAPIAACAPGGLSDAKANSSIVLMEAYDSMATCSIDDGAVEPFVPYPDFNGLDLHTYELDERFAYLIRTGDEGGDTDGIYRLDLDSLESELMSPGEYSHLALGPSELWVGDTQGRVYNMPKDGSTAPELVLEQENVLGLVVDESYLYWHRFTSMQVGCIKRMPLPPTND